MAEKPSLRRSLRARSLEGRPSPSHVSFDEAPASNDADDDDGNKKDNKLAKKKQINQSIQPNRRALRKRKVSFKECVTDLKEDPRPEKKRKCDSIKLRQKILSNQWYVDYYDNDTDSVFDVKKCCLCSKKFFTNFALKKHFDVVHKKEQLSCQSCSKVFSHVQVLKCHERQMHPVRLMPSAMFHTPEIQEILRNCIKQEENIEMSLPQPQKQLPKPQSLLDDVNQTELQMQIVHPPVVTRIKNVEPSTETQPQKLKTSLTEQIFKIPSQIYQRIKTPLKNQLQNFQTSCQTEQQNFPTPRLTQLDIFETQSKEQIVRKALKRKHSFQNSPPKTQNQNLIAPSRTGQLNLQASLICEPETPPLTLPPDRRQSFLHPNYCAICKKQFSQRGYLKVHMESVHALVRQKCELCKKTYCSKSELRKHIKSVHWGDKFEFSKRCSMRTHTVNAQAIERD